MKTNKGEFVLDNQEAEVLPWTKTGYRYVKRQSEIDPNNWVMVGPPTATTGVATAQ